MDYDLDQYRHELRLRIDKGICEVSGLPIFHHTGKVEWDSISIDRIDSTKGYVYSNVRVVCYAVNVALNNWGLEQFLKVARAMETKYLIDNRANDRYNPHSKRVKTKWEIDQYERIFKKPLS